MIKVMLIIDRLWVGGTEQQVVELAKRIDRGVFDVSICILSKSIIFLVRELERYGVRYYLIDQKGKIDVSCIIQLYKLLKKERPQVVHTFLFASDCYGRIAAAMARIPVIISSQRNVDVWKRPYHILTDRILSLFTDRFIVNANAVRKFLCARENVPSFKISVIYNGVDLEKCRPLGKNKEVLKTLDIPEDSKIIGMIAHFSSRKDHLMFLDVARELLIKVKNIYFILIGDGELKDKIKKRALGLGLSFHTKFLSSRGYLEGYDVADVLSIFDVSVLFSHYEGCSNVILESMASAKPVVANNVGGNAELVRNGETGFILASKDVGGAVEKIYYLLQEPAIARAIGLKARAHVEENFSFEIMVKQTEEIYIDLSKKKSVMQ